MYQPGRKSSTTLLILLGVDVVLQRFHLLPRRRLLVVLDGPVHVVRRRPKEHQPAIPSTKYRLFMLCCDRGGKFERKEGMAPTRRRTGRSAWGRRAYRTAACCSPAATCCLRKPASHEQSHLSKQVASPVRGYGPWHHLCYMGLDIQMRVN